MHLRPLPLLLVAAALVLLAPGSCAQQEPQTPEQQQQPTTAEWPSVGYQYQVVSVNAREATQVTLEVAVDTASGRSNSSYFNGHGSDTVLIRNDLGRACLLSGSPTTARDCTCYPISASSSNAASTLPLPDPVSNASFKGSFELLGPEDFGGREVDRWGLSLTTAKTKGGAKGGPLTDSLDVTALLDRATGLPLVVAFYNSSYTAEATAARTEYYRDVRLGVPVSPALFEVPDTCVLGAGDEADEALSVVLHRVRYKPFAATPATSTTSSTNPDPTPSNPSLRPPKQQEGSGQAASAAAAAAAAAAEKEGIGDGGGGDPVKANLALIRAHNARGDTTYSLAANRFVHVRAPAFFDRYAVRASSAFTEENEAGHYPTYTYNDTDTTLPESLDRRADGFVAPVRDQGTCLGSWAAAAAAALETAAAVAGAPLAPLSVQRLLDCVVTPAPGAAIASKGCSGGWPLTALSHVREVEPTGMLPLEEDVPYFEVTGACPASTSGAASAKNSSVVGVAGPGVRLQTVALVAQGDEAALAAAVAEHGAVVVTVQAMEDFWLYGGGIYDNPECTGRSLDHHLTIVGFTPDAWIAKAALGVAWGEGGYIRLARNKNMCGLAEWAVVPIVK